MPTSASDRLGKLFANIPLPSKPDLNKMNATDVGSSITPPDSKLEQHEADNPHLKGAHLSEDSDEDDYVAAFSQKPKMKANAAKKQSKNEARALETTKDASTGPSKPIQFIPMGKSSLTSPQDIASQDVGSVQTPLDLKSSDEAPTKKFCQFNLVSKFPYKYMNDPQDRVSRHFFANNKFYERPWNLYYLHPPHSLLKGPLLLVPLDEAQRLLSEISAAFEIQVTVPAFPFTLKFHDDGTPQPVFLGTSNSREEARNLSDSIPQAEFDHGEPPTEASSDVVKKFDSFRKKCEKALLGSKGKGKSTAAKAKSKGNFQAVQESQNQVKRAERYLGLRPRTKPVDRPEGLSWNEEKANEQVQLRSCGLLIDFLDVNKPAQYPFDGEPVVVCVDIEWYERDNNLITEVGISTLDTLDLIGLCPGPQGQNWVKQIRSRHFRIKGREHLVNRDFCVGDPNAFRFGRSEFVSLDEISMAIDGCFEWPFSVQFKKEGPNLPPYERTAEACQPEIEIEKAQKGPKQRNLVLLGHDVGNDLTYLHKLGSEVFHDPSARYQPPSQAPTTNRHQILSSILEMLDTTLLYQSLHQETQPRSLARICSELGIDAWHTHNGGNDARYTLECFIKLALHARLTEDAAQREKDSSCQGVIEDEMEAARLRRIDEKMDRAREKIRDVAQMSLPLRTGKPGRSEAGDFGALDEAWSTTPKVPRAGW